MRQEIAAAYRLEGHTDVGEKQVKRMTLAILNGMAASKAVRENGGGEFVAETLRSFSREMNEARAHAAQNFPDIYAKIAPTREGAWNKKVSTVYFAMTNLEAEVVAEVRREAEARGWKGDATTGDGVLLRPVAPQAQSRPPDETCEAIEAQVHARLGVRVALCFKRLDGTRVVGERGWPSQSGKVTDSGVEPT